MNILRLGILSLLTLWSIGATAADLNLENLDCAKILERWAENPASVPKRLVDACKEQMAIAPAPVAVAAAPLAAPVDPCAGPNAAGSVLCWGPWATLAPAADAPVAAMEIPDYPGDCENGSAISDQCIASLEPLAVPPPEPPVAGCTPGTPCGFATLVDGLTSTADAESTSFRKFDLAPDGTRFTVDPDGDDEIQSVEMTTNISPRDQPPDGFENMRSTGRSGDDLSGLIAKIVRDDEAGGITLATNVWRQGNASNSALNKSGYFAWGVATSQAGLSLLNGNGLSVTYDGAMSVDKLTNASMTVNFGSQPNWSGTWTNPAWSFGAGGSVSGVNLISTPGQFSSNVQAGGVVQGAVLGEPGQQGIAHIIDVNLSGQGHIKDVGLLREVSGTPGIGTGTSP